MIIVPSDTTTKSLTFTTKLYVYALISVVFYVFALSASHLQEFVC